ncbi:papilin [Trichonephila clavata]|uniref:Papilin n=1 Tax=Trichonephila clavata TaxID=2740835 RepID=A0A8X6GP08_TRICU|nr:papilin [Trichonephila clavata]
MSFISTDSEDTCRLPSKQGPCKGHFPRYFFDHTKGNCEEFVYGGCDGNANNFETERECELACLRNSETVDDICKLPSKTGPCKGHIPRYFFDYTKGSCEEFIYGGCEANANNFETVRECENKCLRKTLNSEETCWLPSEKGPCRGCFNRYFFDHTKGKCEEFIYGGCGGNANNFETEKECEQECLRKSEAVEDICRLPSKTGPCKGHIPRYFFDHTKGSCEEFIYGGCEANANNFETVRECENKCLRRTLNSEDTCRLPSEKGPCRGRFTRYFFDHTKGKCEEFIYGGCKGNANNFETVRECEQACLRQSTNSVDTCRLPSKQGPCKGHFPRYFFDHTKGKCEEFIYGGCDGNANNFETVRECELACLRNSEDSEEKPCSVEGKFKDPESCESYLECSNGVEKHESCPRGLHFNEASGECDSPCVAHCDLSLALQCRWPMYSDY